VPNTDPNATWRFVAISDGGAEPGMPVPSDGSASTGEPPSPTGSPNNSSNPTMLTLRLGVLPSGGLWFQFEAGAGAVDDRSSHLVATPTDPQPTPQDAAARGSDDIQLIISSQHRRQGRAGRSGRGRPHTTAEHTRHRSEHATTTNHHRRRRRLIVIGALGAATAWLLLGPRAAPQRIPSAAMTSSPTLIPSTTRAAVVPALDAMWLAAIGPDSEPRARVVGTSTAPQVDITWMAAVGPI